MFRILEADHGDRLVSVQLDVASEQSIKSMAAELKGFELDIVINNAGVSVEEDFGNWTPAGFEANLKINATGPALVAQALTPLMKSGSRLVNMSSGMGSLALNINPENGLDGYAMSKAALNILTRRLASKLEPRGITVISIVPGWVRTDMGGDEAPITVDESVGAMAQVIDRLTPQQTGRFLAATGQEMPW